MACIRLAMITGVLCRAFQWRLERGDEADTLTTQILRVVRVAGVEEVALRAMTEAISFEVVGGHLDRQELWRTVDVSDRYPRLQKQPTAFLMQVWNGSLSSNISYISQLRLVEAIDKIAMSA